MRRTVAQIVVDTLSQLELPLPELSDKDKSQIAFVKAELESEKRK